MEEQRDFCPRCGAAFAPLQEYCLECGARLPTNRGVAGVLASGWQRRFAWYPGDWVWPTAFLLLVALVATGAVLAVDTRRSSAEQAVTATIAVPLGPGTTPGAVPVVTTSTLPNAPQPTITTGPLPTAPGAPLKHPRQRQGTPKPDPNALTPWPAGKSGYTVVLESLPVAAGLKRATERARLAKRKGLRDVGILVSSGYSSLHPGYYVVFAGIYTSAADASAAVPAAHARGFPDGYQTSVTH